MFRPKSSAVETQDSPNDSTLGRLIDELTQKLHAGEMVDLQAYVAQYPEHAEELSRMLPALKRLADLGRSDAQAESSGGFSAALGSNGEASGGVLGDFRLLREVGRGGMGVVYEAEQVSLRRRVALKVLPLAGALDSKQLQRFQIEAQAAACLHHTHIVPVHAVGCERGVHYYAMQFIEGHSLAELIKELRRLEGLDPANKPAAHVADISTSTLAAVLISGRFAAQTGGPGHQGSTAAPGDHPPDRTEFQAAPPSSRREPAAMRPGPGSVPSSSSSTRSRDYIRTVAQFGMQVAEALDYAHTRGILHRDIKPGNLLLDEPGQLWVTDFGLAQIQSNPGLTLTGDILGTLRYMSPEQALAKRGVIDGRTDIYSLGVTLYELLTLRPAVDGQDRQEILRRIAEAEPVPPRKLNPAVPRDLETILLKAVAKEPSGRYATAKELADELRRFLEDRPIRARRPTLPQRLSKWSRRHKGVAWMGVVLLALVAAGSSASALLVAHQRNLAEARRKEADGERIAALAAQRQADKARIRAEEAEGAAKDEAAKAEAVNRFLRDLLTAGRGYGYAPPSTTLAQVLESAARELDRGSRSADAGPVINPAIEASVRLTVGNTYYQLGMPQEAERHLRRGLELRQKVLVEPSDPWGKEYAETVFAMRELGAVLRTLGKAPEAESLLRQGRQARRRIEVCRIPYEVNASPYTIHVYYVAFSPDSRRLLAGGDDLCMRLFDVATGIEVHRFAASVGGVFSPDGRYILSFGRNKTLRLWDVATAQELRQFKGRSDGVLSEWSTVSVAFSPDGQQALSAAHDKTIRLWDVQTGNEIRQFLGHTGTVIQAVYSPDGQSILSAAEDGTTRLWDVATGTEIRRFLETGKAFPPLANPVAFAPDGRRAFVAYGEGLGWWSVETGQEIRRIPHLYGFDAVAITPDGKRALTSDLNEHRLRLWDVDAGTELLSFYVGMHLHPRRVQVSPDGRFAACGYFRGALSIWRLGEPPLAGEDVTEARQNYENNRRDRGPDHTETLRALDEWAALLTDDGRLVEAEPLLRSSLDSKQRGLGADHADTLAATKLLAGVLKAQNKLAEAEPLLRKCRDGYRRVQGPEHPDGLIASNLLADLLEALGKREEAEVLCRQCFEGWRRLLGLEHFETRGALAKLASSLQTHGKLVEAKSFLSQLLEINLRAFGRAHPETAKTMTNLISLLAALAHAGLAQEAEDGFRKALELMPDNAAFDNSVEDAVYHNNLAWLLATCPEPKFRNPSRAVELAKRAVGLEPKESAHRNTLGVAHYRAGNWKEAIVSLEKSEELAPGNYLAWNVFFLAMAHWQLGDKEQARKSYLRAAAWMEKNKPNDEELRRFRAEAEEVLKINHKDAKAAKKN